MSRAGAAIMSLAWAFCLVAGAGEDRAVSVAVLYETDRAAKRVRCIAHGKETPVFALLRVGRWLYVAAKNGLHRYRIP